MGFLLDTPIVCDLIRHPRGKIFDGIKRVGEAEICTSIVVAAELRFGAARKNSPRLMTQLETILGVCQRPYRPTCVWGHIFLLSTRWCARRP